MTADVSDDPRPTFVFEEHPDHPGWMPWAFRGSTRLNAFLGGILVRLENGQARVRMQC